MSAWVYILKCSDGSYYTGCTTALTTRVAQHQSGFYEGYTSSRLPVELIWSAEFKNIREAISSEREIKGWTRKKKEALMRGDFDLLHKLAQSKELIQRRKKTRSPFDSVHPDKASGFTALRVTSISLT